MDDNSVNPEIALDEAESLIWALLDEQLDVTDVARLSDMLTQDALVRARFVECVQLHVDLRDHFATAAGGRPGSIMPDLYLGASGFSATPGIAPSID
ncbi:MAG: hypothetical protein IT424_09265 [Pirellulales bacterium]|nr:hypothetical protein [Pirellulales bacterium]